MGRQIWPGTDQSRTGGSKVAICALRTLQARLEELENERKKAFEKSADAHQAAITEIEEMKSKYEARLNRYKVQESVLQARIESMNTEHSKVQFSLEECKSECTALRKQLDEHRHLYKLFQQAKFELAILSPKHKNGETCRSNSDAKKENVFSKHANRRSIKKRQTKKTPRKEFMHERKAITDRLRLAHSDKKVPNVAHDTHNVAANVQNMLSSNGGDSSLRDQQRGIARVSIETMMSSVKILMKSLAQQPNVRAYQKMVQLLSKIDDTREKLALTQPRRTVAGSLHQNDSPSRTFNTHM